MPMWRCPHCATPQAETARCWVCHRSSTACGTCRHFRRSVAAQLGYCGLDRQRRPLRGDELRECWESLDAPGAPATPVRPTLGPAAGWAVDAGTDRTPVRLRDFVEVRVEPVTPEEPTVRSEPQTLLGSPGPGWSLWSELEA